MKRVFVSAFLVLILLLQVSIGHAEMVAPFYDFGLMNNSANRYQYMVSLSGFPRAADYTCDMQLSCGADCEFQKSDDDGISPVIRGVQGSDYNYLRFNVVSDENGTGWIWLYTNSPLNLSTSVVFGCYQTVSGRNTTLWGIGAVAAILSIGTIIYAFRG